MSKIWKKLKTNGPLTLKEAKTAKSVMLILAIVCLVLAIIIVLPDPESPLSVVAIPVGIFFLVFLSKFTIAKAIVNQYTNTSCKKCNGKLVFNDASTFKLLDEVQETNKQRVGNKGTGNLIVKREGDHYKVSEEQKANYVSHTSKYAKLEYSCKCAKCGTVNSGNLKLGVVDFSDETITGVLKDYFDNPQKLHR